jgi:DNA-binding FadR family transcriptional regulator
MTAIVIAHLAGNPRFEELARQCQDDLARYDEMRRQHQDDRARSQVPTTQTFAKLVEYLRGQRHPA